MFNPRTEKLLSLSVLGIVALGSALLTSLRSGLANTASQQTIPLSLQPCIRQLNTKRTPVTDIFVRGTYQAGAKTHYLLILSPPQVYGPSDAVLSSDRSGCEVHAQYPSGNSIPVTASIPLSVARHLTLDILKSDISDFGGLQKYQSFLNSAAKDTGKLYLNSNEVWALKQLGIRILPSIKIVSPPSKNE